MSEKPITTVYRGVTITYIKNKNRWNFEVRGRERNTESLGAAENIIDRPDPAEKKKAPFARILAYRFADRWGYDDSKEKPVFESITVTSIAENNLARLYEFWAVSAHGNRFKIRFDDVFADTPENTELRRQYEVLVREGECIEAQKTKLRKLFSRVEVPDA